MNTARKVIIYDDKCPMCAIYTSGFIKWGLIGEENRLPFAQLKDQQFVAQMDRERSRNEIPLVDLDGGRTLYGIDAMLFILTQKLPFLRMLFRLRAVDWFFRRLYKLISYNRRVIVGGQYCSTNFDCAPDFNLKYRVVFMLAATTFALWITYLFGKALAPAFSLDPAAAGLVALAVCGTGWFVHQAYAALLLKGTRRFDYLGHMGMVKITGVLPLLLTIWFGGLAEGTNVLWFGAASVLISGVLMFRQHRRRVRNYEFDPAWTWLWFFTLQGTALLTFAIFI